MEVGKGRDNGAERDFALGNGSRMQRVDDVLLSCTLETHMIL